MLIRPSVYVGLGDFGVSAVGELFEYLHCRLPQALAFVRAVGFQRPEAIVATPEIVIGKEDDGELTLELRSWVNQASLTFEGEAPPTIEKKSCQAVVDVIHNSWSEVPRDDPPQGWDVAVHNRKPRIVLVAQMTDPLVQTLLWPGDGDPPATLLRALHKKLGMDLLGKGDVVGLLFMDPQEGESQPTEPLARFHEELTQWEQGTALAFLLSRSGCDLNNQPSNIIPLWTAMRAWDGEYRAGASHLALSLMLLLLRAGEVGDGGLQSHLFPRPQEQGPPNYRAIALGQLIIPTLEITQSYVARVLSGHLDQLAKGPGRILCPPDEAGPKRPDEAGNLFEISQRGKSDTPATDLRDSKYHQDLARYFIGSISPKGFNFKQPRLRGLEILEGLEFEEFALSNRPWWTGRQELLYPGELLEKTRCLCLQTLQAGEGKKEWLHRIFEESGGLVKLRFDKALEERLDEQVHDLNVLVRRLVAEHGLEKAIEVLQGMRKATRDLVKSQRAVPPKLPQVMDKETAKEILDMAYKLKVKEPINKRSALFYGALSSLILGAGFAYFAKALPLDYRPIWTGLAGLVGPVAGLISYLLFRRRQRREIIDAREDLAKQRANILGITRKSVDEQIEAYRSSFRSLYALRAQRALDRLLDSSIRRLNAYLEVVRTRARACEARTATLSRLPGYGANWVQCAVNEKQYNQQLEREVPDLRNLVPNPLSWPSSSGPWDPIPFSQQLSELKAEITRRMAERLGNDDADLIEERNNKLNMIVQTQNVPSSGREPENAIPDTGPFILGCNIPPVFATQHRLKPYDWPLNDVTLLGKVFWLRPEGGEP